MDYKSKNVYIALVIIIGYVICCMLYETKDFNIFERGGGGGRRRVGVFGGIISIPGHSGTHFCAVFVLWFVGHFAFLRLPGWTQGGLRRDTDWPSPPPPYYPGIGRNIIDVTLHEHYDQLYLHEGAIQCVPKMQSAFGCRLRENRFAIWKVMLKYETITIFKFLPMSENPVRFGPIDI